MCTIIFWFYISFSYTNLNEFVFTTTLHDRHEHQGPTVAVIECPNTQKMKLSIRALEDFPCVSIPSNARDNDYQVVELWVNCCLMCICCFAVVNSVVLSLFKLIIA